MALLPVKRIYGDWTSTLHAKWKDSLLENLITPIQQFSYTTGKNATDSAMIIDAMDIMYTGAVEGFCIVSSDSDFHAFCKPHPRKRPHRHRYGGEEDARSVSQGVRYLHHA